MQNEELLRAETAVQQVSDKYQDLFDFAPIGYFRLDERGRILEVNLAGAALLGVDRSTAVKYRFAQYVAPQARVAFAEFLSDVLQAGGKRTREIELQRNEELVYALVEGVPARHGGANDSLHVTVIDITGRKRAEEKLARATDTLQQTLNIITDCHYMLDRQWRFTRINDRALRHFGMGQEDFLGRCYWEVFPSVVGTVVEEHYKTAVSRRIPVSFEILSPVTAGWAEVHG